MLLGWKKRRARASLGEEWDSDHEVAWGWLWENVEGLLKNMLGAAVPLFTHGPFLRGLQRPTFGPEGLP